MAVRTGHRQAQGAPPPLIIASILRPEGSTGVHTHIRELTNFLEANGTHVTLLTPFSWARALGLLLFGIRPGLVWFSAPAGVIWYRYFHGAFLRRALHRRLRRIGDAVVYAQGPVEAAAALSARRGPEQRVIMAVHFQTSQADEWVRKEQIARDGPVFRAIRRFERAVIPQVDGIVYVSDSARTDLLGWLPDAAAVRSAVIPNFIAAPPLQDDPPPLGDLVTVGSLEVAKNHRFLLQVLAAMNRLGRSLTLDIYGEGRCRKELQRLAQSLDVAHLVRFRGYQQDVLQYLPLYRAYVHASYAETSSFAIIEAMSAGLPIVSPRTGGIPEIISDGIEGRIWSLADPARAAATLLELVDDEDEHSRAAAASLDRFRRDFCADVVGPRLQAFLMAQGAFGAWRSPASPDSPQSSVVSPHAIE